MVLQKKTAARQKLSSDLPKETNAKLYCSTITMSSTRSVSSGRKQGKLVRQLVEWNLLAGHRTGGFYEHLL
jgi:hypothetical protein